MKFLSLKTWLAILLPCLLSVWTAVAGTDTASNRWMGTISISATQTNEILRGNQCAHNRTYRIDVKLAERRGVERSDRSGNRWHSFDLVDEGSTFITSQDGQCENSQEHLCDCPEGFEKNCAGLIKSATLEGSGSGAIELSGTIQYGLPESVGPEAMFTLGAPSSMSRVVEGVLGVEVQRCFDTSGLEFPLAPVPYFVIGGNPSSPITSPMNDQSVRSLASGSDSGSYHYSFDPTGGGGEKGIVSVRVEWSLFRKEALECELTGPPADWRPRHVIYESDAPPASITAKLLEPKDKAGIFTFTLFDVSKELGVALNQGDQSGEDLKFQLGLSNAAQAGFTLPKETAEGWEVQTEESVEEATVQVAAWDYGGWGKLRAEVEVDGKWATCTVRESGEAFVNIPKDDDENHIADSWEQKWGIVGQKAEADDDGTPVGQEPGDGLSNYEEYRGFFTARRGSGESWAALVGTWISTSPVEKDLFIHDGVGQGVGPFNRLGLKIHFVDEDQYGGHASRLINFNTGYAAARPVRGQHGIYLSSCELSQGTDGRVIPWIGSPNYVEKVCVDPNQAIGTADLLNTIGHELGHAVNLTHPGDAYTSAECEGSANHFVRPRGGATSGDVQNIMRYADGLFYVGPDGKCYKYPDYDRVGSDFVSSTRGTGLNGGSERRDAEGRLLPVAGDASWSSTTVSSMSLTSEEPNLTGGMTQEDVDWVNAQPPKEVGP